MSKIVKKPLNVPKNIDFKVEDQGHEILIKIKGPKGSLEKKLVNIIDVKMKDNRDLDFNLKTTDSKKRPFLGTTYRIIRNMIIGVTEGYAKTLEIYGVGYKAAIAGKTLKLTVGFSHDVNFEVPKEIDIKLFENKIVVSGMDKELVGLTAARIREIKKPDPYKGKGIRYQGENPVRKVGKKAAG